MASPRERLRRFLDDTDIAQNVAAERLGVSPAALSMLLSERPEYADRRPSHRVAVAIEKLTGGAIRHDVWLLTPSHRNEGPSPSLPARSVRRKAALSPRKATGAAR